MENLNNEIIKIDDKLSVIKLGLQLYNDVIDKYNDQNDFHLLSAQEGLYIADNYYRQFGPGISYLTTERVDDNSFTTIDLGLRALSIENINQKCHTILIKLS